MAMSNYERAVSRARQARESGMGEKEALQLIQDGIGYNDPISRTPGSLARRIWETGA
jgi:hypothetical protein